MNETNFNQLTFTISNIEVKNDVEGTRYYIVTYTAYDGKQELLRTEIYEKVSDIIEEFVVNTVTSTTMMAREDCKLEAVLPAGVHTILGVEYIVEERTDANGETYNIITEMKSVTDNDDPTS